MATIKDLANRYGLEDYEQLLGGYPNAEKFITGLKDAAVRAVPTTEQMRDPNFIIDTAGLGGAIKAYHGTPHLFDRFDMSKIGTGTGAQAYGEGLYFAQDPKIAKRYMTSGVPVDDLRNKIFLKEYNAEIAKSKGDVEREAALLQEAKDLKSKLGGHIYETSIQWPSAEREAMDPLGEHHLMDWDKSLEDQSDYVKNILKEKDILQKYNKDSKVADVIFDLQDAYPEDLKSFGISPENHSLRKEEFSKYLNKAGIPGLKHQAENNSNYVMFGDEYPQIVKRAGSLDELQEKYAQGGIVKAQDQNENLGKLAEMLGSARDIGNEYKVPSWVPLAGGTGAGDLLMGKTPEEIENWSYGNAPMQIPEMSNVPQFKRGRAQSLADALTTLAPGVKATEGLPAGLSFIGPKSRNWDKVAAELAAKKLDEGADPAEVWREHLIGRMPDKTLFSEISDKDASFKGAGSFGDVVMNRLRALQNAGKKTVDDPMNVADIFKHRDLAESYPELFPSTEVQFLPKDTTLKGSMQVMDDGTNILKMPYDAPHNKKSTMLHELQHAIQKDEGWGQGGSPEEFTRQKEAEHARDVLNWRNEVLARKKKNPDADTNAIENSIIKDYSDMGLFNDFVPSREARELATQPYMMYPERYDHTNEFERLNNLVGEYGLDKRTTPYTPIEGYKRLAGEAQARATQDRLDMDMAQRRENYPLAGGKLSDIPLEELIYKYEGNGPSLDVHGYGTAKKIADVLNTKYGKNIDADISGNDRGLTLNKLIVDADKRNQGIGSNFLKDLTQYADEESLPMQLTAAGDFGGKKARQVSLYKKYGFLENKGKNKDYSISENMYRTPNDLSELSKYKDYVGEHSAPLGDSGAPLHNLTANENAIYPSDVYSSQANQYYGSGEPEDAQLFAMAQRLKDKPNEKVSIYRAVPKMQSNSEKAAQLEKDLANYMKRGRMPSNSDFNNKSDWYEWASNERDRLASLPEETLDPLSINHGDWVALDKKYAKEHGESALGGNYKILSKKVPARQLFTNGDSIREWGWDSRYAEGGSVDKDSLQLNKPQRTPSHPDKSHIVKTMVDGKEKIIRFGEQGAETAGKPKEGESERMTAKRESFKARHAKNIAKGPSSAAYWANKVKWAEGGEVDNGYAKGGEVKDLHNKYEESDYGYGNRPDKTKKGLGYFGELERPDGTGVMTEYSIGVPIHGEEMDVPTLVPTLTPDEIRLILHMQDGDDMPRSIVHKAIDHAHQRLSEGKPIFATEEDLYAHGGIVDVLHNDAIEQIMKAFMDSMADDEEPSAPAVSIEITTQNTETPRRGKIPKSIAREAKHG